MVLYKNIAEGIGMKLEDIARKAAKRLAIAGASAYLILNVLGCNGNATPTPSPTQIPSPKPSPTATYIPEPTATPVIVYTPEPTATPTAVPTPAATAVPTATPSPTPTATPVPKDSYDYANSIGFDAAYLRDVSFDLNSKNLVDYLASLPQQMRSIAESSGLVKKLDEKQTAPGLVDDKQITLDELQYFKRVMDSYRKEIETLKPWLSQLSENEVTAALALNLRNLIEAGYLKNGRVLSLLSPATFFADRVKRMYAAEINNPSGWRSSPDKVYSSTMVDNITNFLEIQRKAWEVANSPKYDIFVGDDARKHFKIESVGSTDAGLNAYEDISLLVREGSPEAKAALRIYSRNFVEGNKGSAPQVRVPLTMIDAWSIGIDSIGVILYGHDVPAINITDEDITLLKKRSPDTLLIVDIGDKHYLPFQWTRQGIVSTGIEEIIQIYTPNAPIRFKIADLPKY